MLHSLRCDKQNISSDSHDKSVCHPAIQVKISERRWDIIVSYLKSMLKIQLIYGF